MLPGVHYLYSAGSYIIIIMIIIMIIIIIIIIDLHNTDLSHNDNDILLCFTFDISKKNLILIIIS